MSCVSRIGWRYLDKWGLEWEVAHSSSDESCDDCWRLIPYGHCAPWRDVREFVLDADYVRVLA